MAGVEPESYSREGRLKDRKRGAAEEMQSVARKKYKTRGVGDSDNHWQTPGNPEIDQQYKLAGLHGSKPRLHVKKGPEGPAPKARYSDNQQSVQNLLALYLDNYAILQAKLQALLDVKIALLRQEHETILSIERIQSLAKLYNLRIPGLDNDLIEQLKNEHELDLGVSMQHMSTRSGFLGPMFILDKVI